MAGICQNILKNEVPSLIQVDIQTILNVFCEIGDWRSSVQVGVAHQWGDTISWEFDKKLNVVCGKRMRLVSANVKYK